MFGYYLRLALASRMMERFARLVVRLEKRRKLPSPLVGMLLRGAENATASIEQLMAALRPARGHRASRG